MSVVVREIRRRVEGMLPATNIPLSAARVRTTALAQVLDIIDDAPAEKCMWLEDDNGAWRTDCANIFEFGDGGPKENGFDFCPYCGKPLAEGGGK